MAGQMEIQEKENYEGKIIVRRGSSGEPFEPQKEESKIKDERRRLGNPRSSILNLRPMPDRLLRARLWRLSASRAFGGLVGHGLSRLGRQPGRG
jgi:hypothetical protein